MRFRRYVRLLALVALLLTVVVAVVLWETTRLSATERALVGFWSTSLPMADGEEWQYIIEFKPDHTAQLPATMPDGLFFGPDKVPPPLHWRVSRGKLVMQDSEQSPLMRLVAGFGPWTGVQREMPESINIRVSPAAMEWDIPARGSEPARTERFTPTARPVHWPMMRVK